MKEHCNSQISNGYSTLEQDSVCIFRTTVLYVDMEDIYMYICVNTFERIFMIK